MKRILLFSMMLFSILSLFAQTTYKIGNPALYPDMEDLFPGSIATCIDVCVDGDTIIVLPGRYYQSANFGGKDIYITSLYKYTGDRADIYNTVLDGIISSSSPVVFMNNETRNAVIDGFTIENGRGQILNQTLPQQREGGGIYIRNANPSILNCVIQNNFASSLGGGISVRTTGELVSPYFAGNIIKNNSSTVRGGGIVIGNTAGDRIQIDFDLINKNSIFLNNAPEGRDIYSISHLYMNVALDTFTVAYDAPLYIQMSASYDFSCENWILDQTNHDIYVSASGDDSNSGLTIDSPLKTINEAMIRINSNPENRNTIHVAPGYYRASEGQIFPIYIKSHVILQGAGQDVTVFDLEQHIGAIYSNAGAHNFKISGIAFINNQAETGFALTYAPILLDGTDNCEISDCHFENNFYGISTNLFGATNRPEPILLKNLSFVNNFNTVIELYLDNAVFENIKILNNRFESFGGSPLISGTPVIINANIGISNTRAFYSLSNILIANTSDAGAVGDGQHDMSQLFGALSIKVGDNTEVLINNATIVNNYLIDIVKDPVFFYTVFMYIGRNSNVRSYNSIFWDNAEFYIKGFDTSTFYIDYSLLEGGPGSVLCNLVWGEGNIDEYPGFDWGYLGVDIWPYQLMASSPCVDAGTVNIPDYAWLTGDIMGNPRFVGETVDMGAYEFGGSGGYYVDFVGTPQTGVVPLTVQFTDTTVGYEVTSWQWDFTNDGIFDSTEQNPSFTYYNTGHTAVRLVINNGQASRVKTEYINPRPAEITGGTLQGLVTASGVPVNDVLVAVSGTTLNATTNEWGMYAIFDILPGEYTITATKEGYETYTYSGIVISLGEVTTHYIVLSPLSESDDVSVAFSTGLRGNYPNPFNPSTVIAFDLGSAGEVVIEVYNIKGAKVKTLVNGVFGAGRHSVVWDGCADDGRSVGSGVYFYRMGAGGYSAVRKMLLLK